MLQNWFKIAIINYKKNWVSTLINLFGLTIGLTGFILILLNWNDETSYESWNPNKENVYIVENGFIDQIWTSVPMPQLTTAKETIPEVSSYTTIDTVEESVKLSYEDNQTFVEINMVGPNFFDIFPFKILAGDVSNAFQEQDQTFIYIDKNSALELFGDSFDDKIGKTININGNNSILKAVYELPESNSKFKPSALIRSWRVTDNKDDWNNFNFTGFLKLKEGADVEAVEKKLSELTFKYRIEIPAQKEGMSVEEYLEGEDIEFKIYLTRLDLFNLNQIGQSFGAESNVGKKKNLLILISLSVLILVLSAINFINLKTAQSSQRAKEVGVRKVLGASKFKLISQFTFETLLICILALGISFLLTELLLPTYNQFLGKELNLNQPMVILYSVLILVVIALISGIVPGIYLSQFKPINTLKGNFSRSKNGIWLRNGILVIQLLISGFFVTSTIIVNQQVNYMLNKELGFNGDQAITIPFQKYNNAYLKYEEFKRGLSQIKGVKDITYSQQLFGRLNLGSNTSNYEDYNIQTEHGAIDINFLKFYHIPIVEGRDFDPKLASDTVSSVVVNQEFVRQAKLTDKEMLNKDISVGGVDFKVIGVVKDFHMHNMSDKIQPMAMVYYNTTWMRYNMGNIQVKIDKNDIEGTLQRIEDYWTKRAEPGYPFNYSFINKDYEKSYNRVTQQKTLFNILNIIVLLVALLGLFALSALLIEQKLKTVAIKKTLGASDKTLVFDLTKQFLIITSIAVIISMPISYYFINEWLKDFAYRIDMPWWPYLFSLVVLLTLTFLVVSFKAYRATQVNLIKYLKYE